MSAVIQLPNPINLRAGMQAVRERAANLHASAEARRHALAVLFREMQEGRSTAASVALANGTMRDQALPHRGYPTPPRTAA